MSEVPHGQLFLHPNYAKHERVDPLSPSPISLVSLHVLMYRIFNICLSTPSKAQNMSNASNGSSLASESVAKAANRYSIDANICCAENRKDFVWNKTNLCLVMIRMSRMSRMNDGLKLLRRIYAVL